jgi:endonuclease/exonuclease/phosphatase family metal-dependent hydrolase
MKIITWNLNHRAGKNQVTIEKMSKVANALALLDADIIVLTEYVPAKLYHDQFKKDLNNIGYSSILISDYYSPNNKVHNRILIASRLPLVPGTIEAPRYIVEGVTNNLFHVTMSDSKSGLDIIGLRMPLLTDKQAKDQIPRISHPWWEWVIKTAREHIHHPFIFIGDFNCSLSKMMAENGMRLKQLSDEGWLHAIPMGSGNRSFYSNPMSKGSTIDHAFLSPQLVLKKAEFILENGTYHFAKYDDALSDHAVLMVEFDLEEKTNAHDDF